MLQEDLGSGETIPLMMQELCPLYYNMRSDEKNKRTQKFWDVFDGLKKSDSINYQFLKKISEMYKYEELTYREPLGAVIQGLQPGNHIFEPDGASNSEQELWKQVRDSEGVINESIGIGETRKTYSFAKERDSVYVFSEKAKYKVAISSVSYQTSDCSSFFTYGLQGIKNPDDKEQILISSNFDLNLEFIQNEKLNELIFERYQPVCADCPESKRYQQIFARLKDYRNFYFTYTREPAKEIDETSVPQRSLIYYDGDLLYTVYSTKIDLFGCGCI